MNLSDRENRRTVDNFLRRILLYRTLNILSPCWLRRVSRLAPLCGKDCRSSSRCWTVKYYPHSSVVRIEDCSAVAFPAMHFRLDVEGAPGHLDSIRRRQATRAATGPSRGPVF